MMTMSIVPSDSNLVNLIASLERLGSSGELKNTENAMQKLSDFVARAWSQSVGSQYRIEKKKISPFKYAVFSREKMVHWLEYGLPSYDMKKTHTKGKKSRVVKPRITKSGKVLTEWKTKGRDGREYTVRAGDSYLIIPFRHKTQEKGKGGKVGLGEMYSNVSSQMKKEDFQRSYVTSSPAESGIETPNAMGDMVKRAKYSWGSRFDFPDEPAFQNLQGLVAMGDPSQGTFMNFRIVSVNSPEKSWIHPGIEAKHHLENILDQGSETIQNMINDALERDFS